jgi:hypothetical protein
MFKNNGLHDLRQFASCSIKENDQLAEKPPLIRSFLLSGAE